MLSAFHCFDVKQLYYLNPFFDNIMMKYLVVKYLRGKNVGGGVRLVQFIARDNRDRSLHDIADG